MITCLGCGASADRMSGPLDHNPDCPTARGLIWQCSCTWQYCDESCDGRWVHPNDKKISEPATDTYGG